MRTRLPRIKTPPPPWLRAACLAGFAAGLAQLFLLDEPQLARDVANATWDKLLHAMVYGGLALFYWMGLGFRAPFPSWVLVTTIGALDEFHQIFIPTRTADVLDVVADAVGAAIVILVLQHLSRAPRRKKPTEGSRGASRTGTDGAAVRVWRFIGTSIGAACDAAASSKPVKRSPCEPDGAAKERGDAVLPPPACRA